MNKTNGKGRVVTGAPLNEPAVPIIYTAPNGDKLTALFSANKCISITQELPRFVSNRESPVRSVFRIRTKERPKVYKGLMDVTLINDDPEGFLAWASTVVAQRKNGG